ncbi:MAG: TRAP transporter small permease [Fretibacterium sp.]|nr:TRAP transporter small permease [Fretibacterium sp.]
MKKILKLSEKIAFYSGFSSAVVLLLSFVLVLAEVVLRSFFHGTLYITEEYTGYAIVFLTFISLAYCQREKGHIRMTFIHSTLKLKGRGLAILEIYALFVTMLLTLIIVVYTTRFFGEAVAYKTQSMQISKTYLAIPKVLIPVGCFMYAVECFCEIVKCVNCIQEEDYSYFKSEDTLDLSIE